MKTSIKTFSLLSISMLLFSCAYTPYMYDDAYYTPGNDPVQQVKKNPKEDFNKTNNITYDNNHSNPYNNADNYQSTPESYYSQNRYTEQERAENNAVPNATNYADNQNYSESNDTEYYDPAYAQTVININSPVRSINTYDPYQRDRILYTHDPYFCSPSLYGNYNFWNPYASNYGLSFGWNSWSGFNMGFGLGFGMVGWNNWAAYGPNYYDPFNPWSRWNAWNPYSGYGYGYSPYASSYWRGYNHGFYDGSSYNGYYSGASTGHANSGIRRTSTPSGGAGSVSYGSSNRSPNRPAENHSNSRLKYETRPERGDNNTSTRPNVVRPEIRENNSRPETPSKYQSDKNPDSYTRPTRPTNNRIERPVENARPTMPNNQRTQPNTSPSREVPQTRPNYTRPARNSYNQGNQVQPSQPKSPAVRPQQSTRPNNNYNNSRPSYNNSRPSYTPSRGGGNNGGGSRPATRPNR